MANVTFSKLKLDKVENQTIEVLINEQSIQVKTYLPIADKDKLIADVLSYMDSKYVNPIQFEVFFNLAIIKFYTNITFTEKQLEAPHKLYDSLEVNGVINKVVSCIPEYEYSFLVDSIKETIKNFVSYNTSFLGVLESVNQDYSGLGEDIEKLQTQMSNKENLNTLKEVLTKLG